MPFTSLLDSSAPTGQLNIHFQSRLHSMRRVGRVWVHVGPHSLQDNNSANVYKVAPLTVRDGLVMLLVLQRGMCII